MSLSLRSWVVYSVTVVVAFCSILYELLLAQTLSTTMGNTTLRYNVTIGLYIASMGVGALVYERLLNYFKWRENRVRFFVRLEIILSLVGFCASFLVLIFDGLIRDFCLSIQLSYHSFVIQALIFVFNHSLIIIIGFLSGLELPLLMELSEKLKKGTEGRALVYDYLGTLAGAVCFPILFLPFIPLFTLSSMVAFLNVICALVFSFYDSGTTYLIRILLLFCLLLFLLFYYYQTPLINFIVERFYF